MTHDANQAYQWLDKFKLIKELGDLPREVGEKFSEKNKLCLTFENIKIIKPKQYAKGDSLFYCNFKNIGLILSNYKPQWEIADIVNIDTLIINQNGK